ncbi:unnamed protein product [Rotaria sp. Silwood2]|nr:unnamed protein product [Rotaria sp. Silwood2]CAF4451837.1 unnamed protein product [Rotaria sp. Silwood2]
MKYSSTTLVDGITTLSLSRSASIPVLDRFLTNDTQIQLKILCRESSANIKETQNQIKRILNKEYEKTKVEIRGRIGRIVGCLPLQSDAFVATNQLTSKDSRDAQSLLQTFYDDLWKQMEQRTFTMQQVNCENSVELDVYEYSNIKVPDISPEKAVELREQFLKQEHEQMTTNQQNNIRHSDAADQMIIKLNDEQSPLASVLKKHTINRLRTWADGYYLIEIAQPIFIDSNTPELDVDVIVSMKNHHGGYITADEYPSLVFYYVMCSIYASFAILWFTWCILYWKKLLHIQFCIGGCILIGLIEKLEIYAEYDTINRYGYKVHFDIVTAEIVSCLKRTVLRMLFIIVALGYDIVRKHLGQLKQKLIATGILYFVLATIEALLRLNTKNDETNNQVLISRIPLAIIDAIIYYWIFTGLVATKRTLRLRQNTVQLNVYRHVTNTLIVTVIASVLFMIWSLKSHFFTTCITNWRDFWIDEAFCHILSSLLILVIMFLFRPSNNNQFNHFVDLFDHLDNDNDDEKKKCELNNINKSGVFDSVTIYKATNIENDTASKSEKQQQASLNHKATISDSAAEVSNGNVVGEDNITTSIVSHALDGEYKVFVTEFERSKI